MFKLQALTKLVRKKRQTSHFPPIDAAFQHFPDRGINISMGSCL